MATDPISASWNRIEAWLQANAPEALEYVQGPATAEQLDAAATQLELQVPDDVREFYHILDGADSSGIFPSCDEYDDMAFSPMSLEGVVLDWEMLKELFEMGDFADLEAEASEGVANDWWNVGWIPFADNGGGDYYCVDMAPTDAGTVGQIISHSHESGTREILASSLAEYLSALADSLEADLFEYDDDYGLRKRR
jgi:cell wall assembly regulator SMI1